MINYYIEKEKRGRMDINIVKKKNERFIRAYFDFMFDVVTFVALHISTLKTISCTMIKTFVFSVVPNLNSTNMIWDFLIILIKNSKYLQTPILANLVSNSF